MLLSGSAPPEPGLRWRVVMLFSMWLHDAEDPEGAAMIDGRARAARS